MSTSSSPNSSSSPSSSSSSNTSSSSGHSRSKRMKLAKQEKRAEMAQQYKHPLGNHAKVWSNMGYYSFLCDETKTAFSAYPSIRTTKPTTKQVAKGDLLFKFDQTYHQHIAEFCIFLKFLFTKNFGLIDFLGYLLPKAKKACPKDPSKQIDDNNKIADDFNLSGENIMAFLVSLYVFDVVDDVNGCNQKVTVKSSLSMFPNYVATLYATEKLSPQEANDIGVYYYSKPQDIKRTSQAMADGLKNGSVKITTTLGYKIVSPSVIVSCGDEKFPMRTLGINGALYGAGEHLEKDEAEMIKKLLIEEKDSIAEGIPIKLPSSDHMCARGVFEECGIILEGMKAHRFIVGINDTPGRDIRYVPHSFEGYVFGAEFRSSMAVLVAVLIDVHQHSMEIKEVGDPAECSKPRLVNINTLVEGFKVGGRFRPAFPMHVEQLKQVVKSLPELLAAVPNSN